MVGRGVRVGSGGTGEHENEGGEPRTSSVRGRRPLIDSAPTMEAKALGRQRTTRTVDCEWAAYRGAAVMAVDKQMELQLYAGLADAGRGWHAQSSDRVT